MAVAMFAIVTFIIVYTSVFKDVLFQNFAQVETVSGGWQIVAGTPDNNFNQTDQTKFPTDVASLVQSTPLISVARVGLDWTRDATSVGNLVWSVWLKLLSGVPATICQPPETVSTCAKFWTSTSLNTDV